MIREKLDHAWAVISKAKSIKKYKEPDCVVLQLEKIGNNRISGPGPASVQEIAGIGEDGDFIRKEIKGFTDYAKANGVGSRGVHKIYILKSGHIYFVSQPIAWKKIRQYYCRVKKSKIIEMNIYQVLAWIKNGWT